MGGGGGVIQQHRIILCSVPPTSLISVVLAWLRKQFKHFLLCAGSDWHPRGETTEIWTWAASGGSFSCIFVPLKQCFSALGLLACGEGWFIVVRSSVDTTDFTRWQCHPFLISWAVTSKKVSRCGQMSPGLETHSLLGSAVQKRACTVNPATWDRAVLESGPRLWLI